mmetsp:Transcript_2054/g.2750  ORF Transcript_2054/g.2750 Transcript_2054/m.2750 type:complete len:330 (+) Transcript_2054:80-1069(+)
MKFLIAALAINLFLEESHAFAPSTSSVSVSKKPSFSSKLHAVDLFTSSTDMLSQQMGHSLNSAVTLLSYSDDPVGDQLKGINGAVLGAIGVSVVALGIGFAALIPKVGSVTFALTEEEEDAIARVENGYDNKAWEKELTEQGTKGFVNRKRQAEEAKEKYQSTVSNLREMKDKSLRYSEANLGFIACLLRAADPQPGYKLVDLGSGTGRSTIGAATIYPSFSKVVGIEFLDTLARSSKGFVGKVRGRKASVEFKAADFGDEDLSGFQMAFVDGKYLNAAEVGAALSTLPSGAKIMTIDLRLGSGYSLVTTVDDPSGDLVLNTGYVYEKL